VDCLPHALADAFLHLFCLVGREELVDVEQELGLHVVGDCVVTGKDLDVTVVNHTGVGLHHVFLDNSGTGHCVVQHVEVLVDCLRGDLLAQTLLQGLVGEVHADDNRPADVVPELLHGSVVHEVQVVTFYEDTGLADLVGHQLALTERDTAKVAADRVVHGHATVHLGSFACFDELLLPGRLGEAAKAVERGVHGLGVLSLELLFQRVKEQFLCSLNFSHFHHSLGMNPYLVLSEWIRWMYSTYSWSSR
jgi:hypothetical protein